MSKRYDSRHHPVLLRRTLGLLFCPSLVGALASRTLASPTAGGALRFGERL